MILPRRKFLTGLATTILAAPAIVRASSLMPVKALPAETILREVISEAEIKKLLELRIRDAERVMMNYLTKQLYEDTAQGGIFFNGVPLHCDEAA